MAMYEMTILSLPTFSSFCRISMPSCLLAKNKASTIGILYFSSNGLEIQNMVCLACLLPLFLIPIVNIVPILFDYIMVKVYGIFGWEYRKPERAPAACPYKPKSVPKMDGKVDADPVESTKLQRVDAKQD